MTDQNDRPLNINDPIPDLLFRKAGLTQAQAIKAGEVLRSDECAEASLKGNDPFDSPR